MNQSLANKLVLCDLDNLLLLCGSIHCFRNCTGFFAQCQDMIVKCADRDSIFYAPLVAGKSAGSALGD